MRIRLSQLKLPLFGIIIENIILVPLNLKITLIGRIPTSAKVNGIAAPHRSSNPITFPFIKVAASFN